MMGNKEFRIMINSKWSITEKILHLSKKYLIYSSINCNLVTPDVLEFNIFNLI